LTSNAFLFAHSVPRVGAIAAANLANGARRNCEGNAGAVVIFVDAHVVAALF
jgi:hypothetical protein